MEQHPFRLLLIEDQPSDVELFRHLCRRTGLAFDELRHIDSVALALQYLTVEQYDLVCLDLSLADSNPTTTLKHILDHALNTPIIVFTGFEDEATAPEALRGGAQDYIVKGRTDPAAFRRAVLYSIERQRIVLELRQKALTDNLTGLHNRHGFLTLARHQLKVSVRTQTPADLIYVDLDGLKLIKDRFGHKVGDQALQEIARVLRQTCRKSDLVARLGGDEFAILTVSRLTGEANLLPARLGLAVSRGRVGPDSSWPLSISVGVSHFDPAKPLSLDDLLIDADQAMYGEKRARTFASALDGAAIDEPPNAGPAPDGLPRRLTPEAYWEQLGPVEHSVQIYADDELFLDALEGFAGGGLRAGEGIVLMATAAHRSALEQRLRARGYDLEQAHAEGRYIAIDAEAALSEITVDDWPDDDQFQTFAGEAVKRARGNGRPVRVFGEVVAVLWSQGHQRATIQLEYLWNQYCEREALAIFCAYPHNLFSRDAGEMILEICSHHSRVLAE